LTPLTPPDPLAVRQAMIEVYDEMAPEFDMLAVH
jgi:hypothetical protein